MKRYATAALTPLVFAATGLLLCALRSQAPASLRADFAQPIVVVTAWHGFGAIVFGTITATVSIAAYAYYRVLARTATFSLRDLIALTALSLFAAGCVPVLLSSDVYAYAAYGELARLGSNPYEHAALNPHDPLFAAAIWQWGNPPPVCVYGPLFVEIARGIVTVAAGFGVLAQLDGMRVIASLALLACVPLVYALRSGEHAVRCAAAATIGLNPVAIWCAAEGHNDALALVVALGGFLALRRQPIFGAILLACSALIKPPATVLLAFAAVDRRTRVAALLALGAVIFCSIPMIAGITEHLAPNGHYYPQASVAAIVRPIALAVVHDERAASLLALAAAATLATLLIVRGVIRLHERRTEGWLWCAIALWTVVPNPYPWYGIWLLALVALTPLTAVSAAALLLSLTSWLRYVPDAIGTPGPLLTVALAIAASLPLCALIPRRASAIMSRSA